VVLTDEGRGLLGGFAAERREALTETLGELSERELEGLLVGARALRRARERRLAGRQKAPFTRAGRP
jgi:hypothetical protein